LGRPSIISSRPTIFNQRSPSMPAIEHAATAIHFEGVTPIFTVKNIPASLDYYVKVLGFKVDWGGATGFASVSRDGCHIMLCEGDQGYPGAWVWIGVGDAGKVFEEYKANGREDPASADQLRMGLRDAGRGSGRQRASPRLGPERGRAHRTVARHAWHALGEVTQWRMEADSSESQIITEIAPLL
jgi:catechol 2,3-dioxygenase-like lactoylglutathione lyase family enzyme